MMRGSSQIQSWGYELMTETLEVKYHTGQVCQYERVPEVLVVLCFEDVIEPGKAWMEIFRARHKETEVKEQY
jgi:hypothetical protein